MEDYWAEGNSNKVFRNLYKNLNHDKMVIVKSIIQMHYDSNMQFYTKADELQENPELLKYLHTNIIEPYAGQKHYNISKGLVKKQQRWNSINQKISEKAPYISQEPSLESIILFLLKQNMRTLKRVHAFFLKHHNVSPDRQKGASSTLQSVRDFLGIHTDNTNTVKQIMKMIDNKTSPDTNTTLTLLLAWNVIDYWKVDESKLKYSHRHTIFDIWNITIYLLSRDPNELNTYYAHLIAKKRKA